MNLKFVLILILSTTNTLINGQNLVPNPSFETHKELRYAWQDFDELMSSWKNLGLWAIVFDNRYKVLKSEIEEGYDSKKYLPHTGHSMVKLSFHANTHGGCPDGGGSYISAKLTRPLDTSQAYSVSYWVFMNKTDALKMQPDLPYYFGLTLDEKPFNLDNLHCLYTSNQVLGLKNTECEVWYQVKYVIKPRKEYTHLMLGVFQNPSDPIKVNNNQFDKRNHYEQEFFLDNILIERVENDSSTIVFPIEKKELQLVQSTPKLVEYWVVYFEKGSNALSSATQQTLDSLMLQIRFDSNSVYSITGHTDNTGGNNPILSELRALAVQHYLTQQSSEIQYQLRYFGASDSLPAAANTPNGQSLNRRVEIIRTDISKPQNLYYLASQFAQKAELNLAFLYLERWLKSEKADPILLLFDPELSTLHEHPNWQVIQKKVKSYYMSNKNSNYAFQLDYLYCQDQWFRSLGWRYKEGKGYIPRILDTIVPINLGPVTEKSDSEVLSLLLPMIEREGWPLISEVGERPAESAVLILLHARDVAVMQKYLPILENACKNKEAKWIDFATMTDRIRLNTGQKQLYGTQYSPNPSDIEFFELAPLENPEKMNEYRAQLGLSPVKVKSFRVVNKKD
jgi:outer membrane protein OmpA-like peptidoglycan-associated protein